MMPHSHQLSGTRNPSRLTRRSVLGAVVAGALQAGSATADTQDASPQARIPLKIAHRASNMQMIGDFDICRVARSIPGLTGVELLVAPGTPNLRDLDVVKRYKREADRWGIMLPSLAGVWDKGVGIRSPEARGNLTQAIRAGEILGVRNVLIAAYNEDCPDIHKPSSYGPAVELIQAAARLAADAGIVLGMETSANPADSIRFIDLVDHPSVKIYYDVFNCVEYGYPKEAIPGIKLIGKERICQVHVKNQSRLIEEGGPLDWAAAFEAFNEIGYDGWYTFETQHRGRPQMLEQTARNIQFLQKHCRMPAA